MAVVKRLQSNPFGRTAHLLRQIRVRALDDNHIVQAGPNTGEQEVTLLKWRFAALEITRLSNSCTGDLTRLLVYIGKIDFDVLRQVSG